MVTAHVLDPLERVQISLPLKNMEAKKAVARQALQMRRLMSSDALAAWRLLCRLMHSGELHSDTHREIVRQLPQDVAVQLTHSLHSHAPQLNTAYAARLWHAVTASQPQPAATAVRELREEMIRRKVPPDASTKRELLAAYVQVGDLRRADAVLEEMKREGVDAGMDGYAALLRANARGGALERMVELYEEMLRLGFIPRRDVIAEITDAYARHGGGKPAPRHITRDASRKSASASGSTPLNTVRSYVQQKRFDEAHNFLLALEDRGETVDILTYNALYAGLMRARDVHRLNAVYEQARYRRSAPRPDIVSYAILIRAHYLVNQVYRADTLFNNLLSDGLQPDAHVYQMLIENWTQAGRLDRVEELVEEMAAYGVAWDEGVRIALVAANGLHGSLERADEIAAETERAGCCKDVGHLRSTLLDVHAHRGSFDAASSIWQRMLADRVAPRDIAYTAMMRVHILQGDLRKAARVFEMFRRAKVGSNKEAYFLMLGAYAEVHGTGSIHSMQLFREAHEVDHVRPFSTFLDETTTRYHVAMVASMPDNVACVAARWALFNLDADRDLRLVAHREHRMMQLSSKGGSSVRQALLKMLRQLRVRFSFDPEADARIVVHQDDWREWKDALD